MIATFINCALILLGSFLGLLLRGRIPQRFLSLIGSGLALCVLAIGFTAALQTENTLCVIVSIVLGAILGEALRIEERLDSAGQLLRARLPQKGGGAEGNSRFAEGFVTASVLFCVGAMAVMGAIEAGIHQNYSILLSKSVIDGITAISFAAAMGPGVAFSALPILIYEGGLTLLAGLLAPYLSPALVTEMSAAGGILIAGIGFNMLQLSERKVKVANLLPAIFLPALYLPISAALTDFAGRLAGNPF
jgi:uncharacterized membrane protein YqgA involved in biofilm formation